MDRGHKAIPDGRASPPGGSATRAGAEQEAKMAGPQRKALDQPDETRQIDKGKVDVVQLASGTVMRTTFEPGWRWSESVQPMVGGDSCQVDHFGYCISGRLRIQMNDGQELDIGPGDVIRIPPGWPPRDWRRAGSVASAVTARTSSPGSRGPLPPPGRTRSPRTTATTAERSGSSSSSARRPTAGASSSRVTSTSATPPCSERRSATTSWMPTAASRRRVRIAGAETAVSTPQSSVNNHEFLGLFTRATTLGTP